VGRKRILVVLRYDDYSQQSPTDFEVDLIRALREHRASCTFGVIPHVATGDRRVVSPCPTLPLDPRKTDILKEAMDAGVVDPALHGCSHQTVRPGDDWTEFAGLDRAAQSEKICAGRDLLEQALGTRVTTFIPPWNSYDLNTLAVLEEQGFSLISADMKGPVTKSVSLKFLPCTCGLPAVKGVVTAARQIPQSPAVMVVLFHAYDFREIEAERATLTWRAFLSLLQWLASQDDVLITSLAQAAQRIDDLSARRFGTKPGRAPYLLPAPLRRTVVAGGTYPATGTTARLWQRIGCFYLLLLLAATAAVFIAGLAVFSHFPAVVPLAKFGSPILLLLLGIYGLHDRRPTSRGLIAIATCLGACIGIWWSILTL
jgi:peptidoglycan/xylan/chitin deacetylase (PgdA/CDA1 family)